MSKQIFSNLTADQSYTIYKKANNQAEPAVVATAKNGKKVQILIKGGHGVANENLLTPEGVCTEVEDHILEALQKCNMFIKHIQRGFIKVYDKKANTAEVSQDMEPKDGSAPLVKADFEKDKAPVPGDPNQAAS